jgi:hypothetical protein
MTNEEKIDLILEWESPKEDFVPSRPSPRGTFWATGVAGRYSGTKEALLVSNTGTNDAAFNDSYQVVVYPTEMRLLSTELGSSERYPTVQTFPLIVDRDEFLAAARMCIALIN